MRCKECLTELAETLTRLLENSNDTAFSRDVEPVQRRVERKDIWRLAHGRTPSDPHVCQIKREQHGVLVACDERQPPRRVDEEAVVALTTRNWDAFDDLARPWVDDCNHVSRLNVNENVTRAGVVPDVSCVATQVDPADAAPVHVEDEFRASGLVGNEDPLLNGVVCKPVRVLAGLRVAKDPLLPRVDRDHLLHVRERGVDATQLRHRDHAVHAWRVEGLDDLSAAYVEDEQSVPVHVGDVQTTCCRIDALVVESIARPWKSYVRNLSKG